MMKKAIFFLLTLLTLLTTVPAITAGAVALLSADDVAVTNNTTLIPVEISNNPGIMGFKVIARYSPEYLEILSVTAGSVTAKGNFIHNAGKETGQVDVIWYAAEQTAENGSLFILTVKPTEKFIEGESTQISLSFSQADTFNEQYEDVAFDCKSINVSYGKEAQLTPTIPASLKETTSEVSITDSQVIDAVDAALSNTESGNVDDIDSDTLAEVNNNLRTIAGPNAPQISSVEELKEQYSVAQRNVYIEHAQIDVDPSLISNTLTNILNSRNSSSFSTLSEGEKGNAIAEAYEKMQEADGTLHDISNILTVDESAEMFDSLIFKATTEDEDKGSGKETSQKNGFPAYIIVIVAVVVCGVVILICIKKKAPKIIRPRKKKE